MSRPNGEGPAVPCRRGPAPVTRAAHLRRPPTPPSPGCRPGRAARAGDGRPGSAGRDGVPGRRRRSPRRDGWRVDPLRRGRVPGRPDRRRWSSPVRRWPASPGQTRPADGDREPGRPAGVVHRRRPGRACGSGFFGGPSLASRFRGTGHLVADFGLALPAGSTWSGSLIGVGGQLLVTLLYAARSSRTCTTSTRPTTKLTGASHGGGLRGHRDPDRARGALLRGAVLPGAPAPGPAPGLRPAGCPAGARRAGRRGRRRVVVDGLLFGLAHGELEQFAGLAVFGCILAFVAYRTGRLGMNMVAHASFNLVAVIAIASSRGGVVH